jgi:hypothetical protein
VSLNDNAEQQREHDAFAARRHLIDTLRDLGAVDLRRPSRTLGFEKRQERADDRPRTAAAWGVCPEERW